MNSTFWSAVKRERRVKSKLLGPKPKARPPHGLVVRAVSVLDRQVQVVALQQILKFQTLAWSITRRSLADHSPIWKMSIFEK